MFEIVRMCFAGFLPRMTQPTDAAIPAFCDYTCPHANFAPPETAGICRTMAGVWCGKLAELVNKNAACEWRRRATGAQRKQPRKKKPR